MAEGDAAFGGIIRVGHIDMDARVAQGIFAVVGRRGCGGSDGRTGVEGVARLRFRAAI